MFIYLAIPILSVVFIMKDFDTIGRPEMIFRFGAFYEGLKIENGRKILLHPIFYLLRRVGMAWIVLQEVIEQLVF